MRCGDVRLEWIGEMEWNETVTRRDGRPCAGCHPVPTSTSVNRSQVRCRQREGFCVSSCIAPIEQQCSSHTPFKRVASPATLDLLMRAKGQGAVEAVKGDRASWAGLL